MEDKANKTMSPLPVWLQAVIVLGSTFIFSLVTTMALVNKLDFGGYKQAAYDKGFSSGLGKAKPGERETSYRVWGCKISEAGSAVCLVTLADDPPAPAVLISIHAQDVREAMKPGSVFKLTRYGATFE